MTMRLAESFGSKTATVATVAIFIALAVAFGRCAAGQDPATTGTRAVGNLAAPAAVAPSTPTVAITPLPPAAAPEALLPGITKRLLGGRPHFTYEPKGKRDPMVIPWVHLEIVSTEHISRAQAYRKEAKAAESPEQYDKLYSLAIEELDRVINMAPGSRHAQQAQKLKEEIKAEWNNRRLEGEKKPTPVPTKKVELPPWILINTKGIVYDDSPKRDHLVLLGDYVLRVGETVPNFPLVKIVEITRDTVVYEYQHEAGRSTRFTVKVQMELKAQ